MRWPWSREDVVVRGTDSFPVPPPTPTTMSPEELVASLGPGWQHSAIRRDELARLIGQASDETLDRLADLLVDRIAFRLSQRERQRAR